MHRTKPKEFLKCGPARIRPWLLQRLGGRGCVVPILKMFLSPGSGGGFWAGGGVTPLSTRATGGSIGSNNSSHKYNWRHCTALATDGFPGPYLLLSGGGIVADRGAANCPMPDTRGFLELSSLV